ncbi:uncharacterized protein LOC106171957, partial [Lingula anatina]|uniref:Uncharacterized protein LOC106171957 n=1 Tax=Lingula anatina TaxID=7574 RepID=A0A1S3JDI0_LINAN
AFCGIGQAFVDKYPETAGGVQAAAVAQALVDFNGERRRNNAQLRVILERADANKDGVFDMADVLAGKPYPVQNLDMYILGSAFLGNYADVGVDAETVAAGLKTCETLASDPNVITHLTEDSLFDMLDATGDGIFNKEDLPVIFSEFIARYGRGRQ